MRSLSLCLIYLLLVSALSCKKFSTEDYTAKIAGRRTFLGNHKFCNYPGAGTVFDAFTIERIDKSTIKGCYGGILKYSYTDKAAHTFNFEGNQTENKLQRHETLSYNYESSAITAGYTLQSYGCNEQATINMVYPPTGFSLHEHTPKIAKTVLLAGAYQDHVINRVPQDSSYTINENVAFVLVNDSSLRYVPNFLKAEDNVLHFKSVDEKTQIIVFQSYYQPSTNKAFTTLTYNYGNNTYVFEQKYSAYEGQKSLTLQ